MRCCEHVWLCMCGSVCVVLIIIILLLLLFLLLLLLVVVVVVVVVLVLFQQRRDPRGLIKYFQTSHNVHIHTDTHHKHMRQKHYTAAYFTTQFGWHD